MAKYSDEEQINRLHMCCTHNTYDPRIHDHLKIPTLCNLLNSTALFSVVIDFV